MTDKDVLNIKREKRILNISLGGTICFIIAELICSMMTGSIAILMDCVYDLADIVMAVPLIILVPQLYKPATSRRPYGYAQIESFFILIKYAVLLCLETILVVESVKRIIGGGNEVEATVIAIFEICVSIICILMYLLLSKMSKDRMSPAIKAELFLWKLAAISTMAVGMGFIANVLLGHTSLSFVCPYVDPVIAIIAAIALAKEPVEMIIESIRNLILFSPKSDMLNTMEERAGEICAEYGCNMTSFDCIMTGRTYWIDLYFDTDNDKIDVANLKALDNELTKRLEEIYDDIWIELIPDVEEFKSVPAAKKPVIREDRIKYIEKKNGRLW